MNPAPTRTKARTALLALLTLLVAAAASLGLAAPSSAATADDEARLFQLTNDARSANGLAPLAYDTLASNVARVWAQELARSANLRHNPNLANQVGAQVTNQWTRIGENVGYAGSIDSVQNAYMNSTGHRNNILGAYNRVGVGSARGSDGRVWTTVVFIQGPALAYVAPSTFAPFSSPAALVNQQYLDFLGRPADGAGLSGWTSSLLSARSTPAAVVAGFVNSPEFGGLVEPIARLYLAFFNRMPDAGGLNAWVAQRRAGVPLSAVANAFAQSSEFLSRYGSLDPTAYVTLVYRNVLGRNPDAVGLSAWVGYLVNGTLNRGSVMLGFTESNEFRSATNAKVKVIAVYLGMLRRAPDPTGLAGWSAIVQQGRPLSELVAGIIGSAEYRARF